MLKVVTFVVTNMKPRQKHRLEKAKHANTLCSQIYNLVQE